MVHYTASLLENVSVLLTHTARVSNVHFRVQIFLCFFNAVLVINITGLLVFHIFLCLKKDFEHVLTTTLVRMTEHCQCLKCFWIVLFVAPCDWNRSSSKFGGRLNGLSMTFFAVCSVLTQPLSFLLSISAFSNSRAKHSRSSTRAIHSLVFVSATSLTSSNSFFNVSTCLLQDSR